MDYRVRRGSAATAVCVVFLALSAFLRCLYYLLYDYSGGGSTLLWYVLLPVAACLLYLTLLIQFGESRLWATCIPLYLGMLFFIIKAFTFSSILQTIGCTLLYLLCAAIYTLTVTGRLKSTLPLILVFLLPLMFHVGLDTAQSIANEMSLRDWLLESSVLCIMAGLLSAAIGFEKPPVSSE